MYGFYCRILLIMPGTVAVLSYCSSIQVSKKRMITMLPALLETKVFEESNHCLRGHHRQSSHRATLMC